MERRDSKTPAGDMWHVLNINRRVEAAEAAIQGMTNLIDTINSEVDELKNNSTNNTDNGDNDNKKERNNNANNNNNNGSISKQEQDIVKKMAGKLKSYDGRFNDLESKMTNMVVQSDIKDLCTEDKVKEMIKENFDNFEPTFPVCEPATEVNSPDTAETLKESTGNENEDQIVQHASTTGEKDVKKKSDQQNERKESVANTKSVHSKTKSIHIEDKEDLQHKKSTELAKKSTVVLKKRDSRESRTRIAYQEVSGKMLYLEQEIIKAKEKVTQLEQELDKKLDLSGIECKSDKTEVR